MLDDPELFANIEESMREQGVIANFEKSYGKITGRMMITQADPTDEARAAAGADPGVHAFFASFDFMPIRFGFALNPATKEAASVYGVLAANQIKIGWSFLPKRC